jgi:hypothetical protein
MFGNKISILILNYYHLNEHIAIFLLNYLKLIYLVITSN